MSTSNGRENVAPSCLSVCQVPAAHMGTSSVSRNGGNSTAPAVVDGSMAIYQVPAAQMSGASLGFSNSGTNGDSGNTAVAASSFLVFQDPKQSNSLAIIPANHVHGGGFAAGANFHLQTIARAQFTHCWS